jgi:uncharacterized protein YndB with AHSA1/START domain
MTAVLLRWVLGLFAALALTSAASAQDGVRDTSFTAQAWAAFTTSEGLKGWAVPVAHADFRIGGVWESTYDLKGRIGDPANIQNRYVSFLPMRMVSWQVARTPPGFPDPERIKQVVSVAEFAELGPRKVRVTLSMVGYGRTEADRLLYDKFKAGNAFSLTQLKKRFATGPIDWTAPKPPKR